MPVDRPLVLTLDTLVATDQGSKPVRSLIGKPFAAANSNGQLIAYAGFKTVGASDTVTMRTKRGYKLSVAAPMVDHLLQADNAPIIYATQVETAAANGAKSNDWYNGFVTGMVCFGGSYSGDVNRPARVVVPGYETAGSKLLIRRLYQLKETSRNKQEEGWRIVKDTDEGHSVILSKLLDRVVAPYLEKRTLKPLFDLRTCGLEFRHGFVTGALSAARMGRSGIRVEHRSRAVIDALHEALLLTFGIRSVRAHQPFAADFISLRGPDSQIILHHLTVERDMFESLTARRLAKRDDLTAQTIGAPETTADPLEAVEASGEQECAQLIDPPKEVLTVNGFLVWSVVS